jgi:hypothetical protein
MIAIYRLDPREEGRDDPRWKASVIKERCWVRAISEASARRDVHFATWIATEIGPAGILVSPWNDEALTTCVEDEVPGIGVPEGGVVITASGRTVSPPF